ncbi:MAG: hypothetical protein AAGB22_09555, partial [Bacteroidota bacterium]
PFDGTEPGVMLPDFFFFCASESVAADAFEAGVVVVGFVFMPISQVRPVRGQWTRLSRVFWHKKPAETQRAHRGLVHCVRQGRPLGMKTKPATGA